MLKVCVGVVPCLIFTLPFFSSGVSAANAARRFCFYNTKPRLFRILCEGCGSLPKKFLLRNIGGEKNRDKLFVGETKAISYLSYLRLLKGRCAVHAGIYPFFRDSYLLRKVRYRHAFAYSGGFEFVFVHFVHTPSAYCFLSDTLIITCIHSLVNHFKKLSGQKSHRTVAFVKQK